MLELVLQYIRSRSLGHVDHLIHNQQVSLNSLETTNSPDVDKNHSRGVFCERWCATYSIVKTIQELSLVFVSY